MLCFCECILMSKRGFVGLERDYGARWRIFTLRNSNERRGVSQDARNNVSSDMVVFNRFLSEMDLVWSFPYRYEIHMLPS